MSNPEEFNELRSINFKMIFDNMPGVEYHAQDASIPAISLDSPTFQIPYANAAMGGSKMSFETLSYTFIVDEKLTNVIELYKWLYLIQMTDAPAKYFKDATLHILDGNKETTNRIIFANTVLTGVQAVPLGVTSGADIITTTFSIAYSHFYFDTMEDYLKNIQSTVQ